MNIGTLLRAAPGKLYEQVAEWMRNRIQHGEWGEGAQIPALDALAKELDVALVTVRQAVAVLEDEGLLIRRHGRGTFVASDTRVKHIWLQMESNWDALVKKWHGIRPRIVRTADKVKIVPLHAGDGEPTAAYHYMRRVHSVDDVPYAVVNIYLDHEIYKRAPRKFDTQRVVPLIESVAGVPISRARETLRIGNADAETAGLLEVPLNAAVGIVRRVVQDQKGKVVFLAEVVYRGDVVCLERNFAR
jgi:GntR family transcriptional regulator